MKILYIIGRLGMGGDTVAVLNTISALRSQGKLSHCKIEFLTHDIGYHSNKVEQLKKSGYKIIILKGDVRKLGPIKYFYEVKKVLQENGPYDVVHIHTSLQSGVALLAAKVSGVPKRICHAHTNSVQRKANGIMKMLTTPIFRYFIKMAATDKVACGVMAGKFLYGNSKFEVVNNGIVIERFEAVTREQIVNVRKFLGIDEKAYVVGHVGRFSEMKNQKFILSLSETLKERKDIVFVLVGDGEQYDEISQYVQENQLNVICTGRRSDIPVLMRSFDLLLLPSLEGEGFPITLVEAQAAMCPCIVSDSVTREADLNLGLLAFYTLLEKEKWIQRINELKVRPEWNESSINKIKQLALDDIGAARAWYQMYQMKERC